MEIVDSIVSFYIELFWGVIIVGNIIRLIIWIKCFKIKECNNDDCRICKYCKKYHYILTEEEKEKLRQMLLEGNE
ncbi:MAG: hypothetical protein K2N73_07155 [Lachnospiraceae bacterium]|nr:hypothetical protein [Lachnospiraceae bacterium]